MSDDSAPNVVPRRLARCGDERRLGVERRAATARELRR
jgi:hypothetical protein